jgi:hypothetical protein
MSIRKDRALMSVLNADLARLFVRLWPAIFIKKTIVVDYPALVDGEGDNDAC